MTEYIDRSAAVSALISVENRYNRNRNHENASAEALYKDLCDAEIEIGKIPAAEVAPVVHGRWITRDITTISQRNRIIKSRLFSCSHCEQSNGRDLKPYCPNCGAKMDMEQE